MVSARIGSMLTSLLTPSRAVKTFRSKTDSLTVISHSNRLLSLLIVVVDELGVVIVVFRGLHLRTVRYG